MDIQGVKNAWVSKITSDSTSSIGDNPENKTPKGLYQASVEIDDLVENSGNFLGRIRKRLQNSRGLCEDFEEVRILIKQSIRLEGSMTISEDAEDINQLVADVLFRIKQHFSPDITFYTLQQMMEKGKRVDEIFDGPILEHGFIDSSDLAKHSRKTEIHASDIIKEIMDVPNVLSVQKIALVSGSSISKNWVFPLDKAKVPAFDEKASLGNFTFHVNGLQTEINKEQVLQLFNQKVLELGSKKPLSASQKDIPITMGTDTRIAN